MFFKIRTHISLQTIYISPSDGPSRVLHFAHGIICMFVINGPPPSPLSPHSASDCRVRGGICSCGNLNSRAQCAELSGFTLRAGGAQAEGVDGVGLQTPRTQPAASHRGSGAGRWDSIRSRSGGPSPSGWRAHAHQRAGRPSRGPRPGLAKPEVA